MSEITRVVWEISSSRAFPRRTTLHRLLNRTTQKSAAVESCSSASPPHQASPRLRTNKQTCGESCHIRATASNAQKVSTAFTEGLFYFDLDVNTGSPRFWAIHHRIQYPTHHSEVRRFQIKFRPMHVLHHAHKRIHRA